MKHDSTAEAGQAERIIGIILDRARVDAIYLYGSRAKQTAHARSDWDIAVLFSDYESDPLARALRPQCLEAELERELKLYNQISVVDLEIAPIYLQYSILASAVKWFDRNVPHVKRVEQSIWSKWEKDHESIPCEQAFIRHQRKMLKILDEYGRENPARWTERDYLAIQRALQIYIESFIGMARYYVQQKYRLSVSQSREALDELRGRGDLSRETHDELLKIVGFRNVLVHDYLDLNDRIVEAIVIKRHYGVLDALMREWWQALALSA